MEEDIKKTEERREIRKEYIRTLSALEQAAEMKDALAAERCLRLVNKFRRQFSPDELAFVAQHLLSHFHACPWIARQNDISAEFKLPQTLLPRVRETAECLLFNSLLVLSVAVDLQLYDQASEFVQCLLRFLENQADNFTINAMRAKVYYYYALVNEKLGRYGAVLNNLLDLYKESVVRLDEQSQVVLINSVLRFYIVSNSYEQARNFLTKSKFNSEINFYEEARHLYYKGRLDCVQLKYSDAYLNLTGALRKAPEACADSFKVITSKLLILVELLMGEVPDITKHSKTVSDPVRMREYFELVKVVKMGDVKLYNKMMAKNQQLYLKDKNLNIIQRLRQTVIKIGLRKINVSYSHISLADITEKLQLDSVEECEAIVAKAIRDGVFSASINHDEGTVKSKPIKELYNTFEPQKAYSRRIEFLNKIHTDAMKSMRYASSGDKNVLDELEKDEEEFTGATQGFMNI